MKIDGDKMTFTSGRTITANCAVIGIGPSPELGVSEGWDGGFDEREWSGADKIELADHMISRWLEYRRNAVAGDRPKKGLKADKFDEAAKTLIQQLSIAGEGFNDLAYVEREIAAALRAAGKPRLRTALCGPSPRSSGARASCMGGAK